MSLRFAAPKHAIRNRMDDAWARATCLFPANDNDAKHTSKIALNAALKHFADHGLAAARDASLQAQAARKSGDEQGYIKWMEICRSLDRRMARKLERSAQAI